MAVLFFAHDLRGDVSVVIISSCVSFLLVYVMGEGVVIVYVLELDHRRSRIDYDDVSGRAGGEPHKFGGVGHGVGAGFVYVDPLSGHLDGERVMDERQDRSGNFRFSPLVLVRLPAFRGHTGVTDQVEIDLPLIDAEQKDQKGGYDKHSDDQIVSDCTLVVSLFWRRVGGTSMNSVFRHICFPPSQDLTILPFSCRCQFPRGWKGRPSGSCCT